MNATKYIQKKAFMLADMKISEKQAMHFQFFLEFHKAIHVLPYKDSFRIYLMPDGWYGDQKLVDWKWLVSLLNEYFNK